MFANLVVSLLAVIAVAFALEGWRSKRHCHDLNDYFLQGGTLAAHGFAGAFLSANLSLGNYLFFAVIWGYLFGWSAVLWLVLGLGFSTLAYIALLPGYRDYIEDTSNRGTLADLIAERYGEDERARRRIARLVGTIVTLCVVLTLMLELHLGAALLTGFIGTPSLLTLVFLTAMIAVYAALGGYRSVVTTDIAQGGVMIAGILAVALAFVLYTDLTATLGTSLETADVRQVLLGVGWANALSLLVLGFGWGFVTMDAWQRACAARSVRSSGRGIVIGTAVLLAVVVAVTLLGIVVREFVIDALAASGRTHSEGMNPFQDAVAFGRTLPALGQALFALGAVGLILAAASTADTFLIVGAHTLLADVLHVAWDRPDGLRMARVLTVALSLLVLPIWMLLGRAGLLGDPLTLFFLTYSLLWVLLIPVLAAMHGRRLWAGQCVFNAICFGALTTVAYAFYTGRAAAAGTANLGPLPVFTWIALLPIFAAVTPGIWLAGASLWRTR